MDATEIGTCCAVLVNNQKSELLARSPLLQRGPVTSKVFGSP